MALGSELAVENETVEWEVGPTKDAIQAFMETLVDPKLPYECFINDTPSEDAQKSIAKQMHAVVLLYNYYHRKQKPELEFLDFVSFCKLAISLRPKMTSFMKMIHGSDAVELNTDEDQFSVTEKAIKNACDIAMSLDASKDVPTTEGYPISKVAVLLIDSEKENCLLQRDVITEGVWSLIEKEIDECFIDQELLVDGRLNKKKTNDHQALADHSKFLQIGFDAVKDGTGIDTSDLVVLEAHVVYSLSKEKSAVQLYIMKCKQSIDIRQRFSFDNLIESLQGPLAEKFVETWVTTSIIEHYCLFPYVGCIKSWLSRKDSCVPMFSDFIAQTIKNKDADKISPSRKPALSLAEYSLEDLDFINIDSSKKKTKAGSSDNVPNRDGEDSQKKRKYSSAGKTSTSVDTFFRTEKHGHATDDPKTRCDIVSSGNKCTSRVRCENVDKVGETETPGKASLSGRSIGKYQCIFGNDDSSPRISTSTVANIPFTEIKKKIILNRKSKNISDAQHDAYGPKDGVNSVAEMTDTSKSSDGRSNKITADNGDANNQTGFAVAENSLAFEAPYKTHREIALPSEDLQNALALLDRKRQGLYSHLCAMEDTLASYEHIIDRVRDGGEVGFASQCIKSLLSGRDPLLLLKNEVQGQDKAHQPGEDTSNPHPVKQTRFSNTYLPGKSSVHDLEYTCLKNNWRLPRYFVQPSDGKFISNAVVHCMGSFLSSKGGLEDSPLEARESAAAQMMTKIRALVMETNSN